MAGEKGKKNEAVLATNTSELLQVPCGGRVLEGLGAFVVFFLPHVPFEASYYEFTSSSNSPQWRKIPQMRRLTIHLINLIKIFEFRPRCNLDCGRHAIFSNLFKAFKDLVRFMSTIINYEQIA